MADDYEEVYDLEAMADDELRELIVQKLREDGDLDLDLIDVRVETGQVRLEGRVGTEQESRQAEQIVTDVLGITNATNELVVDELMRGERSEAADVAAMEDLRAEPALGEGGHRTADTAEHLLADTEHEQFGTSDPKEAIERGFSYNPPTRPLQDGSHSEETH